MADDSTACNIDIKGRQQRLSIFRKARLASAVVAVLHAVNAKLKAFDSLQAKFAMVAALQVLLSAAFIVYYEVKDNTCIVHAAAGTEEKSATDMGAKKVRDEAKKNLMRKKGLLVVAKGLAAANATWVVLAFGPYLVFGGLQEIQQSVADVRSRVFAS